MDTEGFVNIPSISATFPASQQSVVSVMALTARPHHVIGDDCGRSEFTWVRTADGDLMLAIFPYGDDYFSLEEQVEKDYEAAEQNGSLIARFPVEQAVIARSGDLGPVSEIDCPVCGGKGYRGVADCLYCEGEGVVDA